MRPSRQVLDALAGALRLDPAERLHLHELVHGTPGPGAVTIERLEPLVAELVDRLDPAPAYVTGRRWDVLAANRAARALWADWAVMEPSDRNMLWWTFSDPAARAVFAEWEQEASSLLARFRSAAARHPGDPSFGELIDRLHMMSPEVRAWWPRHDIAALSPGTKRLRHRVLGELELRYVVLQLASDPEQKLVSFSVAEADAARLARLIGRDGLSPSG